MSDTEDGSFDKEAEKEKLREQLRREEENRRSTQHMSELLLKGATMTNKHCDTCGDPLFRYDGQEFCPTCSQAGADEAAPGTDGEAAAPADRSTEPTPAAGGVDRIDPDPGIKVAEDRQAGGTADSPPGPVPSASGAAGADVEAARAALARKLTTLARQAEETTDVGRSRELLVAAREAAEALEAVDDLGG